MKAFTFFTIIVILLLTNQMFSQVNDKLELRKDNLLRERIIPHSISDEQISHPSESEIFKEGETRTLVNKTILDNGFLLIESLLQYWQDSIWVYIQKYLYAYDVNNNMIEWLWQNWGGNYRLYTYTYDVNNNRIEELSQAWNGSIWVNDSKNTYTYDVNNNMIEWLWQNWGGSIWVDYYKYIYTYDGSNNLIEEITQYWDGSIWVNLDKNTHIYDGNNNMIEEFFHIWDGSNWVNFYRYTYTYDENSNMIERLWQELDGSIWVNIQKYLYTYDVNNNKIEGFFHIWDGSNWVNFYRYTFTYDGNNNMIEELSQAWNGTNWLNARKETYTYIITGIEELTDGIKTYSLSNNYPNPFNPSTIISYSVPEIEFVTLKVYDVLGSEVATLVNEEKSVGSYEVEFYGTEIVSGIYFYKLQAGSFVETKKMVLMK